MKSLGPVQFVRGIGAPYVVLRGGQRARAVPRTAFLAEQHAALRAFHAGLVTLEVCKPDCAVEGFGKDPEHIRALLREHGNSPFHADERVVAAISIAD